MSESIKTSVVFVTAPNLMLPEKLAEITGKIQSQLPPDMAVVILPPGFTVQHVSADPLREIARNTAKTARLLDHVDRLGDRVISS